MIETAARPAPAARPATVPAAPPTVSPPSQQQATAARPLPVPAPAAPPAGPAQTAALAPPTAISPHAAAAPTASAAYPAPSYAPVPASPAYPSPSYPPTGGYQGPAAAPTPSYPSPTYQSAQPYPAPSYRQPPSYAPAYQPPAYPAPSYPTQTYQAPNYQAPAYQARTYQAPEPAYPPASPTYRPGADGLPPGWVRAVPPGMAPPRPPAARTDLALAAPVIPPQAPSRSRSRYTSLQTEIAEPGRPANGPRNYRVWLGTVESEAQARWEWERLVDHHPRRLAPASADAELVVSERGQSGWRIYAGRFETMADASAFCAGLRADDRLARCMPYREPN
ncbi:hypothetical protein STVA_41180 [Allostella vacuolata]|nr:hypothetical protein STVA_41180 [Stella vacuolata]